MLTGELPMGKFPKPSEKAEVDPSLDAVLDRALEKDVALRYQDIGEFKHAVEAVVLNKKETLQKVDRSDLERQLPPGSCFCIMNRYTLLLNLCFFVVWSELEDHLLQDLPARKVVMMRLYSVWSSS